MTKRAALIAATSHDAPTKLVSEAIKGIPGLLEKELPAMHVHPFFDKNALLKSIFTGLVIAKRKHHRFVLGVFGAHGSEQGLHEAGGELLLELQTCKQFNEAVLVLCSCLHSGDFPRRATDLTVNGMHPVLAVLGYQDKMRLPKFRSVFFNPRARRVMKEALIRMIEQHVIPLVRGESVAAAARHVQDEWRRLSVSPQYSEEFRFICSANSLAYRCWPEQPAEHLRSE
jgi:hypothetical protein